MKPEIAEQWIAALRSGRYAQTQEWLCRVSPDDTPKGFCCLGVLCDLAEKAGIVAHKAVTCNCDEALSYRRYGGSIPFGVNTNMQCAEVNNSATVLPSSVEKWAGLKPNGQLLLTLARRNDTGSTFAEIADYIEEIKGEL